ncbi:MAG TPA: hypothetical protein VNE63_01375 [Candidatus Acidoferrales bacterium]|nr:hypothetical protein [Candidatus Acidoferrales bacterium]
MGFASKGAGVAFVAIGWGFWMLFRTTRRRKAANIKPSLSYGGVLFWDIMGLDLGLIAIYGWQAFHRPLLYMTVLALAATVATATLGPIPKKSIDA